MNGRVAKKLKRVAERLQMTPREYKELKRQVAREPKHIREAMMCMSVDLIGEIIDGKTLQEIANEKGD